MLTGSVRGVGLVAVVLLTGACGGRVNLTGTSTGSQAASSAASRFGQAADATAVRVIRGWSDALRRGDVSAAAQYFALPSQMINGTGTGQAGLIRIHSLHDAVLANEALPCGAVLVSAVQHGPFVDARFRLTGRPGPGGSACTGGVGASARTFFLIVGGRIRAWIRAPDPGTPPGAQPPASA